MPDDARPFEPDPAIASAIAGLHAHSWGWALACTARREDDAREVLQDTYERVLSGRARFEGRSSIKTWLFGVIRRVALEHRRSVVVRWLLPQRPAARDVPDSVRAPDSNAHASEMRAHVAAALAELSPKQREVMHLVFYEDLTISEAAEIMNVSLGTARLHYDRGKKSLALALERRGVKP